MFSSSSFVSQVNTREQGLKDKVEHSVVCLDIIFMESYAKKQICIVDRTEKPPASPCMVKFAHFI